MAPWFAVYDLPAETEWYVMAGIVVLAVIVFHVLAGYAEKDRLEEERRYARLREITGWKGL